MKESHLFYAPQLPDGPLELPQEEASHAVRVLRMKEGDELLLTNGCGTFFEARLTMATPKHCCFAIERQWDDPKPWAGSITVAVAPTKNMDRMEWLVEKATEIGFDRLVLLLCDHSERRTVKTERLEKVAVSAMKQSHKAYKPAIVEMTPLKNFLREEAGSQSRFIAHCFEPEEGTDAASPACHLSQRNFLSDLLRPDAEATVLIGPEGDFSLQEIETALAEGWQPVSLGESRLRTETAALVAVHLMRLAKR